MDVVDPVASGWQLITAGLAGIALIVVLITLLKLHPFIALILGGLTVGIVAGENVNDVLATAFASKGTPSGGVKQSGVGGRHGDQGLLKYTDVQNLAVLKKQVMGARPGQDYDEYVKGMLGGLKMMRKTGIR